MPVCRTVYGAIRSTVYGSVGCTFQYAIHCTNNDSIRNSFGDSFCNPIRNSLGDSISHPIRFTISNSIWETVRNSFCPTNYLSIKYSIWTRRSAIIVTDCSFIKYSFGNSINFTNNDSISNTVRSSNFATSSLRDSIYISIYDSIRARWSAINRPDYGSIDCPL